jgi:hypothetical protein
VLFAKVDVCIAVHPKFCTAGPAAVGYWVAALAYSCGQELDGRIPKQAIGAILAVGPKRGRAFCERLVSAGLFVRTDDGYAIAKFSQKNVTKAQLDARRREGAERMAVHRVRTNEPRSERPRDGGGDASQGPSLHASREGVVLNSLSLDLGSRDLHSEDSLSHARASVPPPSPEYGPIPPNLALTPEARAGAEMLGVRDIDGEWVKFVAHHRANGSRSADFYALWTKWAVMARNYERRDRERDARRAASPPEVPPAPYHATAPQRLEVDVTAQLKARLANSKTSGSAGNE